MSSNSVSEALLTVLKVLLALQKEENKEAISAGLRVRVLNMLLEQL